MTEERELIRGGDCWSYKSNDYFVKTTFVKMKDASDGNWYEAVLYYSAEDESVPPELLCRRKDDFLSKFKRN